MTIALSPPVVGKGSGDPRFYLPGSGSSLPMELRGILEYNGIYLHNRNVIDRYFLKAIEGLDDADVRDSREINPSDDGETPFNSYYGGRTIVMRGEIQVGNLDKMADMREALKVAFLDIRNEYPLIIRTGDINRDAQIFCKKIGKIEMPQEWTGKFTLPFQVTLRASRPELTGYLEQSVSANVGPGPNYGPAVVFTPNNNGIYDARPIVRFDGPMTSGTLLNVATGKSFTITNIPSGSYFVFDTKKKTVKDQNGINQYNLLSDNSDYVWMKAGPNDFQFTGSGLTSASAVTVTWRHTWI